MLMLGCFRCAAVVCGACLTLSVIALLTFSYSTSAGMYAYTRKIDKGRISEYFPAINIDYPSRTKPWQKFPTFKLVICSRYRVPGPGSEIHYPIPNPGNEYPVFCHNRIIYHQLQACIWICSPNRTSTNRTNKQHRLSYVGNRKYRGVGADKQSDTFNRKKLREYIVFRDCRRKHPVSPSPSTADIERVTTLKCHKSQSCILCIWT